MQRYESGIPGLDQMLAGGLPLASGWRGSLTELRAQPLFRQQVEMSRPSQQFPAFDWLRQQSA